jgi:phospholysine phosphohistidine inorganic pyrophosphate phosphatase
MKAILFDIDGVLYNAGAAIPGAAEAIASLRARGIPSRFLTNTTMVSRAELAKRLGQFGVDVAENDIIHPPSAAAAYLRHVEAQSVALFVNPSAAEDFTGVPLLPDDADNGADYVVVGDLGDDWNFATLNRAFRLLHSNRHSTLIALGMSRYWHAADGLRLDVAPFVAALEYAIERKALVLGKPALPFFQMAIAGWDMPLDEILMVGDDVRTDVGAAQIAGLRGMLVRTGKYRPGDLQKGVIPDAVIDTVAELPQWWDEFGVV